MFSICYSPSAQENNQGVLNYGTEETEMNLVADIAIPMLEYIGFKIFRPDRTWSLDKVVQFSNDSKCDAHFAQHSNAGGGGTGTEIYHYLGSVEGLKFAKCIYNEVAALTPMKDRGIMANSTFAELKRVHAPACLVEIMFHDNPVDVKWFMENRENVAKAIVRGICAYFGVKYKEKSVIPASPIQNPSKIYRVQVGAYGVKENADLMVDKLKKLGIPAIIV